MSDIGFEVTKLAADVATEALSQSGAKPLILKTAETYRRVSLTAEKTKYFVHLMLGNYAGCLLIIVTEVGVSAAADFLAQAGGLVVRLYRDDTNFNISGDFLNPARELPNLNPFSLSQMDLRRQEEQGDIVLRAAARSARLAQIADEQAQSLAGRPSTSIAKADTNLDAIRLWMPPLYRVVSKLRRPDRVGIRKFGKEITYSGSFKDDVRDGFGTLTVGEHASYSGIWKNDAPFGYGMFRFANRGTFAGAIREPFGSARAVGLSRLTDGTVHVGEHRAPIWGQFEQGKIDEFSGAPDGFGYRQTASQALRGLWSGPTRTLAIETEFDIEKRVMDEFDPEGLPDLMTWKAYRQWQLAVKNVDRVSRNHDVFAVLNNFSVA